MENAYIYLIIAEGIIILAIIGIKLLFNYFENKKIKSVLNFIDRKAQENKDSTTDRLKECIEIIKQNNKEEVK